MEVFHGQGSRVKCGRKLEAEKNVSSDACWLHQFGLCLGFLPAKFYDCVCCVVHRFLADQAWLHVRAIGGKHIVELFDSQKP